MWLSRFSTVWRIATPITGERSSHHPLFKTQQVVPPFLPHGKIMHQMLHQMWVSFFPSPSVVAWNGSQSIRARDEGKPEHYFCAAYCNGLSVFHVRMKLESGNRTQHVFVRYGTLVVGINYLGFQHIAVGACGESRMNPEFRPCTAVIIEYRTQLYWLSGQLINANDLQSDRSRFSILCLCRGHWLNELIRMGCLIMVVRSLMSRRLSQAVRTGE